jgi:hypothetical protein
MLREEDLKKSPAHLMSLIFKEVHKTSGIGGIYAPKEKI